MLALIYVHCLDQPGQKNQTKKPPGDENHHISIPHLPPSHEHGVMEGINACGDKAKEILTMVLAVLPIHSNLDAKISSICTNFPHRAVHSSAQLAFVQANLFVDKTLQGSINQSINALMYSYPSEAYPM
jgi:hypothetical protein